ncbi:MAG: acyl-CoA thioesterase [Coleofasciculus sp. G3-WIS-01]|uniref:acyl-CoA thioesterase n=1 Tax=Coleofasciculus sp. G3-WIS-01 TaxID=3069528 RepID=UPI0032FE9D7E
MNKKFVRDLSRYLYDLLSFIPRLKDGDFHYRLSVNNAVYQNYLEQAAVEHAQILGYSLAQCRKLGGVFVMRRIEIDYLRPATADDTLGITTWLQQVRNLSLKA